MGPRVGVQPAAQLRHVQGHDHAEHVLRELGPAHLVGVGKLRLAQLSESKTFIEVWVTVGRVYGNCSRTQPAICVWRTHHLHRRERGGGEDTAMCGSAAQPKQGCAVRQVPVDMWEWRYGSELTRRGGGDHGQRLKRVWGANH